ncbi:hypothetical protein BRADI_3g39795v3 [Brachypodium distachyon]|uniref:HECT-type E3 ubiquitin transferase n=2 Tax=Brachypodium distachyon TaxID=15368 RepID=A0A2K2D272_BRADI|nr:hypothetical protein BRADI_3g39795v3 [Brachypodium distachyon]
MVGEFLDVFVRSGLARLLVRLYLLSTWPVHHYRAKAAMECFLDSSAIVRMPLHVKAWTAPLCLSFCQAMVSDYPGNNGREDPLYKDIRGRLAVVIALHGQLLPKEWVINHLTPFAVETANEVIANYNAGFLPETDALLEFKKFFSALCREMAHVWQQADNLSLLPSRHRQPQPLQQTIVLTLTAIELLMLVDQLLSRLPPLPPSEHMVNTLWVLLATVDSWTDVRSDHILLAGLRETIRARAARLNALVLGTGAARSRQEDVVRLSPRLKRVLWFDARRHLAAAMLPMPLSGSDSEHLPQPFELLVDRTRLLENSFVCVSRASRHELLNCKLTVRFLHEEASHSQAGVTREWLVLVCRALFDPQLTLFCPCPHNRRRFFLNEASAANHRLNLQYLNFAGRIIGLALMYNVQVGVLFDRTLFVQLAMDDITEDPLLALDDIADADPLLHASCRQILEMEPVVVGSGVLGLTPTRQVSPGGRNVAVNSLNRRHFVDQLITNIFVNSTKEQLVSFAEGFSSMLVDPGMRGAFFRTLYLEDLDKMLGGSVGAIDVEEWKGNVEYRGYNEEDEQIKWFWEAVESMTAEEQRRLLFFWTSVEYLPLDGFRGLGFGLIISRALDETSDHLPSSSTCLNLLNLPSYTSFAMTLSRLKIIAQEHV